MEEIKRDGAPYSRTVMWPKLTIEDMLRTGIGGVGRVGGNLILSRATMQGFQLYFRLETINLEHPPAKITLNGKR